MKPPPMTREDWALWRKLFRSNAEIRAATIALVLGIIGFIMQIALAIWLAATGRVVEGVAFFISMQFIVHAVAKLGGGMPE